MASAVADLAIVRVYNLPAGKLEYEVLGPRAVACVRFSPDGTRLAMTGYDSQVYLCEAKSGHMFLQLTGTDSPPGTVSTNPRVIFSADGRYLATNNWQGEITVWNAGAAIGDDAAIKSRPNFADAFYNLGHVRAEQGQFKVAAKLFAHVLKLRPGYLAAEFNLAKAAEFGRDSVLAEKYYRGIFEEKNSRRCHTMRLKGFSIQSWDDVEVTPVLIP